MTIIYCCNINEALFQCVELTKGVINFLYTGNMCDCDFFRKHQISIYVPTQNIKIVIRFLKAFPN